jgi:hypothetical protein
VAGFCEHENEQSADIREEGFLFCLNEYYFLRTTLIQHLKFFFNTNGVHVNSVALFVSSEGNTVIGIAMGSQEPLCLSAKVTDILKYLGDFH